jgi:hypothetical protein
LAYQPTKHCDLGCKSLLIRQRSGQGVSRLVDVRAFELAAAVLIDLPEQSRFDDDNRDTKEPPERKNINRS